MHVQLTTTSVEIRDMSAKTTTLKKGFTKTFRKDGYHEERTIIHQQCTLHVSRQRPTNNSESQKRQKIQSTNKETSEPDLVYPEKSWFYSPNIKHLYLEINEFQFLSFTIIAFLFYCQIVNTKRQTLKKPFLSFFRLKFKMKRRKKHQQKMHADIFFSFQIET